MPPTPAATMRHSIALTVNTAIPPYRPMTKPLHCILCQGDIAWNRPEENLLRWESMIRKAPEESRLVILPEMCLTGFVMEENVASDAAAGTQRKSLAELSTRYGKHLIAGLNVTEDGKRYNRMQFFSPTGEERHYDKRHLFRMGGETQWYSVPDDTAPSCATGDFRASVFPCEGWRLYPQICYDLRFPESCRNRYLNGEFLYDCLVVIANWPQSRSEAMRTLAKARAIENMAYVLLVNRIGTDGNGIAHNGESAVIDFKGNIVAELPEGEEGLIEARLSYSDLQDFRHAFPNHLDW